ncbi:MAG: MotA/TolQ/ExbB proton channel family protein [Planctomycetota bacterium]
MRTRPNMLIAEFSVFELISNATYLVLAGVALWGLYCIVVVWHRVGKKRFKNEDDQDAFLDQVLPMVDAGQFENAANDCDNDTRALPQLISLAGDNFQLGYKKTRQLLLDRFQRDVMKDLEYRLSWVNTVIKTAPMIGLFGTVFGMMGAFEKLATSSDVDPAELAGSIRVALVTTACGLAIAIPLMIMMASVNIRIEKMQDLIGSGLNRFLASLKAGMNRRGIS